MRSLLLCLVALWVGGVCGNEWDSWNLDIAANGGAPLDNSYIPGLPTGISRNKGASLIDSNTSLRKNQYMFYYNSGGIIGTCRLYCGPRSYLVKDPSNSYYTCYRDQSTHYFGSLFGPTGALAFPTSCVPDVFGSCAATGLSASVCTSGSIPPNYQAMGFTSCCYGGGNNLLDRTASTSYTNLFNSE